MNQSRSAINMSDEPATWPDDDEDPFAPEATDEESAPVQSEQGRIWGRSN